MILDVYEGITNGVLRSLFRIRLVDVAAWPVRANDRCKYCPEAGCHSVSITAKYDYHPFPIDEENVVLENWNYLLDRSVNVTTIVVQHGGQCSC